MDNNQWNNGQPQYNQQPMYGGQPQYNQQSMYNQQPMYNQPMYAPYGQPMMPQQKSKKGLIIGLILGLAIIAIAVILIIVILGKKDGYHNERCERCKTVKACKEYTLTGYGESHDYWVCDDCYPDCKERAEEMGGTLEPK